MEPRKLGIAFLLVSLSVLLLSVIVSEPLGGVTKTQVDASAIVEEVTPAVVQIETEEGLGSGFIIQPNGYILTNRHVVSDRYGYLADSIWVHLKSGKKYKAEVLKTDEDDDLALLKIPASDLPTVKIGDSDQVGILDYVIVLGYPLGTFTVTDGKISAIKEVNDTKVLQMTAAINPGSSGGPVIDAEGNVIGVVSVKIMQAEGFNFAVAINEAKSIMPTIQDRIDAAHYGDTIKIEPGTYEENLTINKNIDLIGADKGKVIIKGHINVFLGNLGKTTICGSHLPAWKALEFGCLSYDPISIKNLTITKAVEYGIYIEGKNIFGPPVELSNLVISNIKGKDGEYAAGILLQNSNAFIRDTKITKSYCGIFSLHSEATIRESTFSQNDNYGLCLFNSTTSIEGSKITQNEDGGILAWTIIFNAPSTNNFITVTDSLISENSGSGIVVGAYIEEGLSQLDTPIVGSATIVDNQITNNGEYGMDYGIRSLTVDGKCVVPTDYILLITGSRNNISGNDKGNVCPEELKFLMSQKGEFLKFGG